MKSLKNKKGFTLVELIVVIVILLILSGAVTTGILKYVQTSKEAKVIAECKQCVTAANTILVVKGEDYLLDDQDEIAYEAGVSGNAYFIEISGDYAELSHLTYENDDIIVDYCMNDTACDLHESTYTVNGKAHNAPTQNNGGQNNNAESPDTIIPDQNQEVENPVDHNPTLNGSSGQINGLDKFGDKYPIYGQTLNNSAGVEFGYNQGFIKPGTVLTDGKDVYVCTDYNNYYAGLTSDTPFESLLETNRLTKIEDNKRIYTDDDIEMNQWNKPVLNPSPKKGDIYFKDNKYYIAMGDMDHENAYFGNNGMWLEMNMEGK